MKCVIGLMRFDIFSIDGVSGIGGDEVCHMVIVSMWMIVMDRFSFSYLICN